MKISILLVVPLLIAGSSAVANAGTDTNGVGQLNNRQARAASFYGPPRGLQRRSRDTRRALTQEIVVAKRQTAPELTPEQIREAILALPNVQQLPQNIQQFLATVPVATWSALRTLTPEQFKTALSQLESGQLPNIAGGTAPNATPNTQPQVPATQPGALPDQTQQGQTVNQPLSNQPLANQPSANLPVGQTPSQPSTNLAVGQIPPQQGGVPSNLDQQFPADPNGQFPAGLDQF